MARRQTAPVFALYLLVIVAGIAGAIAIGLVREADDDAAGVTVERFAAAIEAKDGAGACALLTEDAVTALQSQEKKSCEDAILSLDLSGGRAVFVDVADTSAVVDLSEGDRAYLDKTPSGWRIGAAGCKPQPNRPYDCELES